MAIWTLETGRRSRRLLVGATLAASLTVAFGSAVSVSAQPAQGTGVRCLPMGERAGRELGCWVTATEILGELPSAESAQPENALEVDLLARPEVEEWFKSELQMFTHSTVSVRGG